VAGLPQRKVAAVLGAGTPYTAADYTRPTAVLIGAEDEGLAEPYRALADDEVEIPMSDTATADSLNAGAAAAILLFEARRQRGRG
jgi:tRNA G18 (ribose-2'-O)-methylase SpoU